MSRSLTQAQWSKYSKSCEDRRQKQLQACFDKGAQAYKDGVPQHENPLISNAWRAMWARGWQHAAAKDSKNVGPPAAA